ncbi:hypothetical protein KY304_01310 [Candidatus Woesearchaeota archaeon]|nr:hypothetical protein [Candidatus Woesearchaeota archaeon]MBW2978731.1 hypothetical protein [Candidatus Woesearchaeota archaeon]
MKQICIWTIIGILLIANVIAECQDLPGTGIIDKSIKLCSDTYDAPEGIKITADNIIIDCGTAIIRGNYLEKTGITIDNRKNVTLTRCNIMTFNVGVFISNSTNIHLKENAVLKNDVGVRLYNSYENLIEKHNDKSNLKPISALNSKFNIVMLGNKNIDKAFCKTNACNTFKDMNPCEDNDFYCSDKCSPETDNDCKKKEKITTNVMKEIEETNEKETEENNSKESFLEEKQSEPKKLKKSYIIFPIFYLIGLIMFQFIRYVKEFDKEDR